MNLIEIRPHADLTFVSAGRSVLCLNNKGFAEDGMQGFFVLQARILSRIRFVMNGYPCRLVTASNIEQNSWLGYFLQPAELCNQYRILDAAEQALELKVLFRIDEDLHADLEVVNYSKFDFDFELGIELDSDFADLGTYSVAPGLMVASRWNQSDKKLYFDARAEHEFEHQDYSGVASFHRTAVMQVCSSSSAPQRTEAGIAFKVSLAQRKAWSATLNVSCIDLNRETARQENGNTKATESNTLITVESPEANEKCAFFIRALARATSDLQALEIVAHGNDSDQFSPALIAGIPKYTSLFARDSMQAAWQSTLLGNQLMKGCLNALTEHQGTQYNDWIDERPGRMPHEIQTGPLAMLRYKPTFRNYGTITSSPIFCIVLTEMWRWTGDTAFATSLLDAALKAIADVDKNDDVDGSGFYKYQTRSTQGVQNQGWKDSDGAIVYPDGTEVATPIGTCDHQGYVYLAKLNLAQLLEWLGRTEEARRFRDEAFELKKRFNDKFWMEEEKYVAIGIDSKNNPIRSIASNPGHCLATGIIDQDLVPDIARRMFHPDLFNGWGIRTLSSDHPSYNPWSYHRGSVWPEEQATFALGFKRYSRRAEAERLVKAQLDALALFSKLRFPEVFAGHARDQSHPFPGIYPEACWPQAWSASAPVMMLHSLLGTFPVAPMNMLCVDPNLPEWCPDITLHNLHVGESSVSIRFFRQKESSSFEVLNVKGPLKVVKRSIHWQQITCADLHEVA